MLNTQSDITTEVLVRNNRSTTDSFITDTNLTGWYVEASVWAAAYKKWPFTEGRVSTTFTTGAGVDTDEWSFEGYKADSFRLITIGGKRLTKLNFDDYQIMREELPDSNDRVFSDFGRTVYINPKIDLGGTLTARGQFQPAIDITDELAPTVFSNFDREGNEAIIEKMSAFLKRRENVQDVAELHDQRASVKLEEVWKRIEDEQYRYQTHPARDGMWKPFDVLSGGFDDTFKRNQF